MSAEPHDPSALEDHLGYWLRFVSNHVSQAFRLEVEACGVRVSEWVVLRELFAPGSGSPGALVRSLGMTKGAVSKLVDRLESKGLATRAIDEGDRRQQVVRLTARGRALVPRLARLADDNDAHFFGHLSPELRATLVAAMRQIVAHHHLHTAPIE